jgi:flagellar biosynthesis/type III secretory pathway protein FliH
LEFRFPVVKLLDYADRVEELERSDNPFAILVLAHLKAQETQDVPLNRLAWKFRLVKGLFQRGWSADRIRSLFRFIDWMMDLPAGLAEQFSEQLSQFEEEQQMSYVTSIERMAIEKGRKEGIEQGIEQGREQGREQGIEQGREQGLLEGIECMLELRFGTRAESILREIRQLSNVEVLERVLRSAKTASRPEDLVALWSDDST